MPKWFNTAGPCQVDIHYMLPPLRRFLGIERLVAQRGYFVIHAPRQTGKTTAMLALADQLRASGGYTAVMVSAEVAAAFVDDVGAEEEAMLTSWRDSAKSQLPEELHPPKWPVTVPGQRVQFALMDWAEPIAPSSGLFSRRSRCFEERNTDFGAATASCRLSVATKIISTVACTHWREGCARL